METQYYKVIVKLSILAVLSVFIAATAFAQIYPAGMISYWKFDESSGPTAVDSMGINNGTVMNSPTRVPGMVGGALSLDGIADYVLVPYSSSLDIAPSTPFTFEAWIYLRKGGVTLLDKNNAVPYDSTNYRWIIGVAMDSLDYRSGVWCHPSGVAWFSQIPPNQWVHVVTVLSFSSGNPVVTFYLNGILAGSGWWNSCAVNSGPLFIGRDIMGRYLDGYIDELAIYNRALTQAEIQKHYQNGLHGKGYEEAMALTCIGFEPPMDKTIEVKKKNRVLPLKIVLVDQNGNQMTNNEIFAPVVVVDFTPSIPGDTFLDEFLYAGQGDEGNQFVFTTEGKWQFNLQTKNFTAGGTYTIKAVSGDPAYVIIDPTCSCDFVLK